MASNPLPGFTGAYKDAVSRAYPLGNGYRWHLPALMRFTAPDDFSPFGPAGVNPYGYCSGDPVNRWDPTGHLDDAIANIGQDIAQVADAKVAQEGEDVSISAQRALETAGRENRSQGALAHGVQLRSKQSSANGPDPVVKGARPLEDGATAAPPGQAIEVMKRPIYLRFRFATKSERVVSIEAEEMAERGDAIMTGTRGEQWVIKRRVFRNTYEVDLSTYDPYLHTGFAAKKPMVVGAEQRWTAFEVNVPWQKAPLRGNPGDFLVTYGVGDHGVVAQHIFYETYMTPDGGDIPHTSDGRLIFAGG